ncbi:FAD-dependent oxidoreductase [Oerskovia flava]|uniref:FAD-dependent oxidoreductase n=1 Tax=Oerskovia flava TaxID=2986422 RepID=UPI00223F6C73|nr:FAD-dependent oxidoreductase [Oerskovia sp. JB1-3-2]
MTETVSHVVVGGGVMGSAAAWQLARRGHDVVLLERFGPGHTHGASHGASRIYRTTYGQVEYLDLAEEALRLWRELEGETGGSLLDPTGGVSHGVRDLRPVAEAFSARGIEHAWLSPDAAAERWPGLRFEGRVLHEVATAGRLHADRSVAALQQAAKAYGADLRHETPVRHLEPSGDGVRVVTDVGVLRAARVVLAVGAWSAGLLRGAGIEDDLPVVVTQEQPVHFATAPGASAEDSWPSFVHDPGPDSHWPSGTYGLATPGEGIKVGFHGVGPVIDPDRRSYTADAVQLGLLRDYARTWIPGVDPDRYDAVTCTYTTTPDHDFVLDRRGPLVVAAGFSGHGFKFAPAVGRVLADLTEPDARPAPARFELARAALARSAGTRPPPAATSPTPTTPRATP